MLCQAVKGYFMPKELHSLYEHNYIFGVVVFKKVFLKGEGLLTVLSNTNNFKTEWYSTQILKTEALPSDAVYCHTEDTPFAGRSSRLKGSQSAYSKPNQQNNITKKEN